MKKINWNIVLTGFLIFVFFFNITITKLGGYGDVTNVFYDIITLKDNNLWVNRVYDFCNDENTSYEKIYCVNDYVNDFFVYNESYNDWWLHKVDDNFGGNCESSALFYKSVFNMMGFKNHIDTIQEHIFNIVEFEEGYCKLDMKNIDCMGLGNE